MMTAKMYEMIWNAIDRYTSTGEDEDVQLYEYVKTAFKADWAAQDLFETSRCNDNNRFAAEKERIYDYLEESGATSCTVLSDIFHLPNTTVANICATLITEGKITKFKPSCGVHVHYAVIPKRILNS